MRLKFFIFVFLLVIGTTAFHTDAFSALIQNDTATPAADLKLDHRFGTGVMFAGQAGLLGASFDLNFNPFFSTSAVVGTGYEYTTLGFKAQYYILGTSFHPYLGAGYAYWWAGPGIINADKIHPSMIYSQLLNREQQLSVFSKGFNLHLIYPTFGVQFVHATQFSLAGEIMYLFDITDFSGSPYFGFSSHYYF